jgi:hypothetical protein
MVIAKPARTMSDRILGIDKSLKNVGVVHCELPGQAWNAPAA